MRRRLGGHAAHVAPVGTAIGRGVGVQDLAPAAGAGQAAQVVRPLDRREVADHRHRRILRPVGPAQPRIDRMLRVVGVDPAEAAGFAVLPVQRRILPVDPVQIPHQQPDAVVRGLRRGRPVQADIVVPFLGLAEFLPHEQQLLARVAPHEAVIGAQVGEPFPVVPRHPRQHRALAVDHLVMADRQDEVLGERIVQPEGHLVVMILPVDRVVLDVAQGVVHPPHVPLVAEAQAAGIHGTRHRREAGAFLGHGDDPRHLAIGGHVHPLEHRDRFQVLAPAMDVGDPLAFLPRIVAVEHRGHRIDPEAVDVELLEPVERVRDQEVGDLGPAVVEDQRVPVLVEALARVFVLVERGAVEAGQAMGIGREMAGHPVDQHAQTFGMGGVDQVAEFVGRPVADRRREQTHRLIAPRAVERILADRHQLDMGEAHVMDILHQIDRRFLVGQGAVAFLGHPLPRAQMHLVDRHRRIAGLPVAALLQPGRVAPAVAGDVAHHRGGLGRVLGAEADRVGLQRQHRAAGAQQLELVAVAFGQAGNEDLPHPGGAAAAHRVTAAVPLVEVAHHRHPPGIGRPDGEMHAADAFMGDDVGPQHGPQPLVAAFAQEVFVLLAHHRAEAEGVLDLPGQAGAAGAADQVAGMGNLAREDRRRGRVAVQRVFLPVDDRRKCGRVRMNRGQDQPLPHPMRPQDGKRIPVGSVFQCSRSIG